MQILLDAISNGPYSGIFHIYVDIYELDDNQQGIYFILTIIGQNSIRTIWLPTNWSIEHGQQTINYI